MLQTEDHLQNRVVTSSASAAVQKSAVTRDITVTSGGKMHNLLFRGRMNRQNSTTVVHIPTLELKKYSIYKPKTTVYI